MFTDMAVYTAVFTANVHGPFKAYVHGCVYCRVYGHGHLHGREHGRIYARVHGPFRIVVTGEDAAGALYEMTNSSHTIRINVANHVML